MMKQQDLAALAVCAIVNTRAGFGLAKSKKSLRERDILGRGAAEFYHPMMDRPEKRVKDTKEQIKAREQRILALHEANRKKDGKNG